MFLAESERETISELFKNEGIAIGKKEGIAIGVEAEAKRYGKLMTKMLNEGRTDEAKLVGDMDVKDRMKLYKDEGIVKEDEKEEADEGGAVA